MRFLCLFVPSAAILEHRMASPASVVGRELDADGLPQLRDLPP